MLSRIATLPLRAARRIARFVLRGGRPAPPEPYAPPPTRYSAAPRDEEEHEHDHGHGHEHEDEHEDEHEHEHDHGHAHEHERREVHVRAEETPNPSAMKFVVGVPVGAFDLSAPEQAEDHALAKALFALDGVKAVFGRNDFVTVTKTDEARWDALAPKVAAAIEAALG
jgi:hypothetical protein